jgi:hypothetical protein
VRTDTPSFIRAGSAWTEFRERIASFWQTVPPGWRGDRALLVVAAVIGLSLLAAFHQVVHAGVDRAAARDAAAHRHQKVAAICSVERTAELRALCVLTAPSTAPHSSGNETRVATASR